MIKNKTLLILITTLLLNFNLQNSTYAIEDIDLKNKYPNYAEEFVGKDTCENYNRKMFIFNKKVNKYIVRPVNIVWASVMPKYGMERVQNVFTNVEYPIRLVSCLLQKDYKSSKTETFRFLTNTTMGIGGLYDPAKNKFNIEPVREDMGQVLAYRNVKRGPYIVLPVVAYGNVRDLVGQLLDCPLNPTSYVIGPIALIAKSVAVINKTTYMQPIAKTIDYTYADPYDIVKKLHGVEKYIKQANLDRKEVLAEKAASNNIIEINNIADDANLQSSVKTGLKADIEIQNYNSQGPLVDSMRTALFENQTIEESKWSEMSVWNKTFSKKIKTSSVNIDVNRPNYKYRYILQKDKTAPLAIIYPSFGEGIMSHHSTVLAKTFYDEGYSVIIQGSVFQWEFVKSMPDDYKPGYPSKDAHYSKLVTSKILDNLESKDYKFSKKLLVGTSFGALTTLFVAQQEENAIASGEKNLGISNYISICPPIEALFALSQVDKYSQDWRNNPNDIKSRAAVTVGKILQVSQNISDAKSKANTDKSAATSNEKPIQNKCETLPFTDDEAKLIIGFVMKQKLSDLVFTIENGSKSSKSEVYESINNMSFYDYAQKYLRIGDYKSYEQLNNDTSLISISEFLRTNQKYKIYHSLDDYYVNPQQLAWLKKQSSNKAVFFNNGSHLGFLYRQEFMNEFKKDIKLQSAAKV